MDRICQKSQILSNIGNLGKPASQNTQQRHPRPRFPSAFLRTLCPGWNRPIVFKGPEVVDADGIKQVRGAFYPANPPAEAIRLLRLPVIQGIAPELAFL